MMASTHWKDRANAIFKDTIACIWTDWYSYLLALIRELLADQYSAANLFDEYEAEELDDKYALKAYGEI
jgi:hypothetical protein